jgi:signal transduction histidine kinase
VKRKILSIIIGLICLSLAGIIAVQYFWIRNAIKVRESQFDRSVNDAMGNAVNKLETREDIAFIRSNVMADSVNTLVQAFANDTIFSLNNKLDSLLSADEMLHIPPPPPPPPETDQNIFTFEYHFNDNLNHLDTLIRMAESAYPEAAFPDSEFITGLMEDQQIWKVDSLIKAREASSFSHTFKMDLSHNSKSRPAPRPHPPHPMQTGTGAWQHPNNEAVTVTTRAKGNPPGTIIVQQDIRNISRKAKKIKDVIKRIATEMEARPMPLTRRIDTTSLKKSLAKTFADKDIDIPFEYAVLSPSNDTNPIPIKSSGFNPGYLNTAHRISLFPNDVFQKHDQLLVYFPGQKRHLLKSLSWLALSSVFFTIIIVITSIISIFFMLRQKKISDIKTDFINNMTHEFKTPLATISIAIDSINNPKIIDAPEKIRSFTKVIREENNRMNARVEEVLQMALLDSKDFRLVRQEIDLNALIRKVTDTIRIQVESKEGTLDVAYGADHTTIKADEVHLSNVFMNLLDNANKYSPGKPEISVAIRNTGSSVAVSVEDKGIGMSPETQHRIFEKFFRVTSGNIHNVKGFGLGLSYAKAIILAHKGALNVSSEPGKGSRFEVVLPLAEG